MIEPECVTEQNARVEVWRVETSIAKSLGERPARLGDGNRGRETADHAESSAASSAAWLSVTSASTISPSASPSITCGSLWSVKLIR